MDVIGLLLRPIWRGGLSAFIGKKTKSGKEAEAEVEESGRGRGCVGWEPDYG